MSTSNRLQPQEIAGFLRRYRFSGGRIRHVRIRYPKPNVTAVEFVVSVEENAKKKRLLVSLEGVEEFRFQMRPGQPKSRILEARIGYLKGLFYVAFDSLGLDPNEVAQVFDYRAAEVYAAGRDLFYRELPPRLVPPDSSK
jgi:hypothetical protein